MSNRDPYTDGPAERGWSAGSIAAAVVAMILVIAAISSPHNNSTSTASRSKRHRRGIEHGRAGHGNKLGTRDAPGSQRRSGMGPRSEAVVDRREPRPPQRQRSSGPEGDLVPLMPTVPKLPCRDYAMPAWSR